MLNRFIFSYYYFVWTELMFVYRLLNRRMYSRIRRNSIHTGKSNGRNQCESMAHKTGANLYIYTIAYTWTKSIQLNFNWNTCHPSRCKVNPFLFSRYLIICLPKSPDVHFFLLHLHQSFRFCIKAFTSHNNIYLYFVHNLSNRVLTICLSR